MSVANQISSIIHDDPLIPLDLRYRDFLDALSDIRDETMRNRCHKYWTSLYRYFDRSMTNERALIVEEKRTHEILHRLDIEVASRRSEITYQIRNILQQEHQVLSDLHMKYNRKKNNLREIEQNIDDLENKIQKQKSERSFITVSSSTSLYQITETIDDLKLQIKNLHMTRKYNRISS
jgi:predicted component of type VI protein secretion system